MLTSFTDVLDTLDLLRFSVRPIETARRFQPGRFFLTTDDPSFVQGSALLQYFTTMDDPSFVQGSAWCFTAFPQPQMPARAVLATTPSDIGIRTDRDEGTQSVLQELLRLASEGTFEDGVETDFSRRLLQLIKSKAHATSAAILELISSGGNDEVAAEALRWIGRIRHTGSHKRRLSLLIRSLEAESARVRDGALLGLASMNDPAAIEYVRRALEREEYGELRDEMRQLLEQLQQTARCRS